METPSFLDSWDQYMIWITLIFAGFGVLVLLYHEFRVLQIKDFKEKYDYVNLHEIKYFWYAIMSFILATAFYSNSIATDAIVTKGMLWFYVRIFIVVSLTIIGYFIFSSLVRIYYPRYLEKRLTKLRSKPRISPAGNIMRKLHEHEEDAHLEADQAEEQATVHTVDYDVWLDDKTGFKKIEKYDSWQHAIECTECGYFTMKIDSEEIEKKPSVEEDGMLLKHYKCTYCKHRELREVVLAKLSTNS